MKPFHKQVAERPPKRVPLPGQDTSTTQILLLARRVQGDYLHRIRKTGLTPSQANVLRELAIAPGLPQHELAIRLEIGKVSVGEALTKLEQAGYVCRERRTDNRRLVRVTLTPGGESILQDLSRAAHEQMEQLSQQVGADTLNRLTALLILVNKAIQAKWPVGKIE